MKRKHDETHEEETPDEILRRLSARKKCTKEIESTVAGEAPMIVETLLPSFFDSYPRAERALHRCGNRRNPLIYACDRVLRTGDETDLQRLTSEILADDEPVIIDIDDVEIPPKGFFQWQADGGQDGWMSYAPDINNVIEGARIDGKPTVDFFMFGSPYQLNFDFMVQRNLASTTVRPIRQIPK